MNEPDPLLTPKEAGPGVLRKPEKTLAEWRSRGIGPRYIKVGRDVRYRRSDLDAWITEHTVDPGLGAA
jgi:hypothetical protein